MPVEHFTQPSQRALRGAVGKRIAREKPRFDNLAIRQARPALREIPHHEQCDVITLRGRKIEIHSRQFRRARKKDVPFFTQLHLQSGLQALPRFNATAGQMPAGNIGMAHQKDAPLAIQHQRAHTKRHAAREEKPQMREAQKHTMAQRE